MNILAISIPISCAKISVKFLKSISVVQAIQKYARPIANEMSKRNNIQRKLNKVNTNFCAFALIKQPSYHQNQQLMFLFKKPTKFL